MHLSCIILLPFEREVCVQCVCVCVCAYVYVCVWGRNHGPPPPTYLNIWMSTRGLGLNRSCPLEMVLNCWLEGSGKMLFFHWLFQGALKLHTICWNWTAFIAPSTPNQYFFRLTTDRKTFAYRTCRVLSPSCAVSFSLQSFLVYLGSIRNIHFWLIYNLFSIPYIIL